MSSKIFTPLEKSLMESITEKLTKQEAEALSEMIDRVWKDGYKQAIYDLLDDHEFRFGEKFKN